MAVSSGFKVCPGSFIPCLFPALLHISPASILYLMLLNLATEGSSFLSAHYKANWQYVNQVKAAFIPG